jgi:hypothetical protein
MRSRLGATGAILFCCALAAGCGSAPHPAISSPASAKTISAEPARVDAQPVAEYQSPVQATLSWFAAINQKDKAAAIAHFAPAAVFMMNWGGGDITTWPTFSALHCTQVNRSGVTATVLCTFSESQAPSVGNPDSFWTVELKRQPDERWLITNYGQG